MRTILGVLSTFLLWSYVASASDAPTGNVPSREQPEKVPEWSVRVEVLMVAMPQEKALPLLPDLRKPEKIDGAVEQILAALERKEALLMGYPMVHALDGERCVCETIIEKRYPTEYVAPSAPESAAASQSAHSPLSSTEISDSPPPSAFETRNAGVTLEVEPQVIASGESVRINVVAQRVVLLGFDSFNAGKAQNGVVMKVEQPQFSTIKTTASLVVRNGQRSLLAVHKLSQPDDYIEFFILQAFATPVK